MARESASAGAILVPPLQVQRFITLEIFSLRRTHIKRTSCHYRLHSDKIVSMLTKSLLQMMHAQGLFYNMFITLCILSRISIRSSSLQLGLFDRIQECLFPGDGLFNCWYARVLHILRKSLVNRAHWTYYHYILWKWIVLTLNALSITLLNQT